MLVFRNSTAFRTFTVLGIAEQEYSVDIPAATNIIRIATIQNKMILWLFIIILVIGIQAHTRHLKYWNLVFASF